MNINFEYHNTRLDVYIDDLLCLQGCELIGYEIKGSKENLKDLKFVKLSLTREPGKLIYEVLGTNVLIILMVSEESMITWSNMKMTVLRGNSEILIY
jgi:hypothetical protein